MLTAKPFENAERWDKFVFEDSFNGNFLHTRRFLSYHQEGRFNDRSFLIHKDDDGYDVYALFPGCQMESDGKKTFYSHPGSTYGGPVINKIRYTIADTTNIIETAENYLSELGYKRIIYKITPDIFSDYSTDLLQYLLSYNGYREFTELSSYVYYGRAEGGDVMSLVSNPHRRRRIRKCVKEGLRFRELSSDGEIRYFHGLLTESLKKYGVLPVHTVDELLDFKHNRLREEVSFFGVFLNDNMIGGSMTFSMHNRSVFHIQYSTTDKDYDNLGPMAFLFYELMCEGCRRQFAKLSWGVSTENRGAYLNRQLAETKESYGSVVALNRTFQKDI